MSTSDQKNTGPAGMIIHEAIVHKANIALAKDESLHDYTNALGEQVRAHVIAQKRMDTKSDYCYIVEVYPSLVVVSYSMTSNGATKSSYGYVAVTYERGEDKAFKFSDMVEVERVTTYRPKTLMKVLKGVSSGPETEAWGPREGAPGWSPVTKGFWNGVV